MDQTRLIKVALKNEHDVVLARQRTRQIAALLRFDGQDQVRMATAVSEIARNAQRYASAGVVEFRIRHEAPASLVVEVSDAGGGIANLQEILAGRYHSRTGMGLGLIGAMRLVDDMDIQTAAGRGTTVTMVKHVPDPSAVATPRHVEQLTRQLASFEPRTAVGEVQAQNQELLQALADQRAAFEQLEQRQAEIERLNRELHETNQGVMALYAELDQHAERLRRASEHKSRFISYMSHEFRTPLASMRSIGRLLLDRMDGDLTGEQETQVRFIVRAAQDLNAMVDDLLDLARIEAGRMVVNLGWIEPGNVIASLRGVFRPIVADSQLTLWLDDAEHLPAMHTDEQKLTQILRNLLSNAIKFTEAGRVELRVAHDAQQEQISFTVTDTGIGIPPEKQEAIFEEFTQVDTPLQQRVKGTGLGLPLCKRLAAVLGGRIEFDSTPGVGSAFRLTLPVNAPEPENAENDQLAARTPDATIGAQGVGHS